MQSFLQHFAAKQIGKNSHAAEEDTEVQEVELKHGGERNAISGYAARPESEMGAQHDQGVHQCQKKRIQGQQIYPPAAPGKERFL
jgi:hypothetical protein